MVLACTDEEVLIADEVEEVEEVVDEVEEAVEEVEELDDAIEAVVEPGVVIGTTAIWRIVSFCSGVN